MNDTPVPLVMGKACAYLIDIIRSRHLRGDASVLQLLLALMQGASSISADPEAHEKSCCHILQRTLSRENIWQPPAIDIMAELSSQRQVPMEVLSFGMSRTGTASMREAFEILGIPNPYRK